MSPESAAPIALRFELWRKAIHLASGAFPLGYAVLGSRSVMLWILAVCTGIAVAVEVSRRRDGPVQRGFALLFGRMLRAHEQDRAAGATWLLASYLLVVAIAPAPVAIAAMCAVSFGDALAALVGRMVGRTRLPGTTKTLEGSLACLLVTFLSALFVAQLDLVPALTAAVAATLAELPRRPWDDNARVALGTAGATYLATLA